jgi:hypothetical protein
MRAVISIVNVLFAATSLAGCFWWSHESHAGAFVTDVAVQGESLVVSRCDIGTQSDHVVMIVPLPNDAPAVSQDSVHAMTSSACGRSLIELPVGIQPPPPQRIPPWCVAALDGWSTLHTQAAWDRVAPDCRAYSGAVTPSQGGSP